MVCEGELDAVAGWCMGFKNLVSLPNGAGNFDPEHWDVLSSRRKIFLILDPDGAGREGMKSISTRLGQDRCINVKIPGGMDINDLLIRYGPVDGYAKTGTKLQACLDDGKPCGAPQVFSVASALKELRNHIALTGSVETGFSSPWYSLNNILGMISPGEVILLQAIPKTGKTTLLQQWLSWLAIEHRIKSMMYCLEMPIWRQAQMLVSLRTGIERDQLTNLQVLITELKMREVPFYYGQPPKIWSFAQVKDVITYAKMRYGIQILGFDNFQLLCRGQENATAEQAAVSAGFKQLASELDLAIILVVQPRKVNPKVSPGMYDPSGSGALIADSDGMITMWREPLHSSEEEVATPTDLAQTESASFKPETLIRVPASRYRSGGSAWLLCNGAIATFSEVPQRDTSGV